MLLRESQRSRRPAFTLMEMLIVVAIIVALASIGVVSYYSLFEGSKLDVARAQVKSLTVACDAYRLKHKQNPPTLDTLTQPDQTNNNMVYIEDPNVLLDPWNQPYQYEASGTKNNGRHADIWCVPQGAQNESQWIVNWPRAKTGP